MNNLHWNTLPDLSASNPRNTSQVKRTWCVRGLAMWNSFKWIRLCAEDNRKHLGLVKFYLIIDIYWLQEQKEIVIEYSKRSLWMGSGFLSRHQKYLGVVSSFASLQPTSTLPQAAQNASNAKIRNISVCPVTSILNKFLLANCLVKSHNRLWESYHEVSYCTIWLNLRLSRSKHHEEFARIR